MTIIYALAQIGFVDICDPKNSDFRSQKDSLSFMVVFIQAKKISSNVFKENVAFMEKRYELMSTSPKFQNWEELYALRHDTQIHPRRRVGAFDGQD